MKVLKITYYIIWTICILLLMIYLFGPFGGPLAIISAIKSPTFNVVVDSNVVSLYAPPYQVNPAGKSLYILSSVITLLHFITLTLCALTMAFYKMDLRRKYVLGISFGLIATLGTLLCNLLWRYLVKVYLGI